jgi:hypothetical protein
VSDYQPRPQRGWPEQPPADVTGHGERPRHGEHGDADHAQEAPGPRAARSRGARRRARRKRWPIAVAVTLVLLLAALAIGDQVARTYAQNAIAKKVETSGLNARPSVSIGGWPFLTQVLAHDVGTVKISANDVTANSGKLKFSFTATATGVHLNSSFNGATVDHIDGTALLPFSSVASLIPGSGATITADPAAGPNAVKASLGAFGSVTGIVTLTQSNLITVQLKSAQGLAALASLSGRPIEIEIPPLPAGLVVKSAHVSSQGIVAVASASHTKLSE